MDNVAPAVDDLREGDLRYILETFADFAILLDENLIVLDNALMLLGSERALRLAVAVIVGPLALQLKQPKSPKVPTCWPSMRQSNACAQSSTTLIP